MRMWGGYSVWTQDAGKSGTYRHDGAAREKKPALGSGQPPWHGVATGLGDRRVGTFS